MLEFYAHHWLKVVRDLERLTSIIDKETAHALLLGHSKDKLLDTLAQIIASCESMKLDFSASYGKEILEQTKHGHALTKPAFGPEEFRKEILILRKRIDDELKGRTFFLILQDKIKYFNEPWVSFGQSIVEKFPSLSRDIEEAGKSYAAGRNPACVFHLMRIMEAGLRALGKSLSIPSLDPQLNPSWERILDKCNEELNKPIKDRCAEWKADNDFFSQASANLLAVKNAWRNPTMHVGIDYSDDVALDIYNAARGFMRHLATKLSE